MRPDPDRPRYTATVRRDGEFWLIHIPERDLYTQARFEGEVELMGRDVLAIEDDVDADSFDLDIVYE